jgi:diadenosine tetraphosphate (Ap4A) HIT family hydrolase
MAEPCCELGAILSEEPERVLCETDNFFVAPTLGPIGIEGYLLILSKECFKGIGGIPDEMYPELEELQVRTREVLREVYGGYPQVFEHGPRVCDYRGGSCLDHAHLHVVPGVDLLDDIAVDLMHRLENPGLFYRVERIESYQRASEIFNRGQSSYFMAESPDGRRMLAEVNFYIPSQYMRRLIGKQTGTDDWDWGVFPEFNMVEKTIDALQGKFN